jgi:hypothetical protein
MLGNHSFALIEIEIVKKVNTTPYSVAKLTRVQVGPSVPQQGNKIITHFQSKVSK